VPFSGSSVGGKLGPSPASGGTNTATLLHHTIELPRLTQEEPMLWTIFVILLILWLLGFSFHVAGGLIHLLLVVAVVVLIINLVTGRRTV
jgi:hypothetical protein